MRTGAEVFGGPRFRLLHRRWLAHGDAVLDSLSSTAIAEALTAGTGREERLVLEHSYKHLSPLVERGYSITDEPARGLRAKPRRGPTAPRAVTPSSSTPFIGATAERRGTVHERLESAERLVELAEEAGTCSMQLMHARRGGVLCHPQFGSEVRVEVTAWWAAVTRNVGAMSGGIQGDVHAATYATRCDFRLPKTRAHLCVICAA